MPTSSIWPTLRLHAPPVDGERHALHAPPSWPSSRRRIGRAADQALAIELADLRRPASARRWRGGGRRRRRPRRWPRSTWRRRWPSWPAGGATCGPRSSEDTAFTHRGRPPPGGRGGAARGRADRLRAQRLRARRPARPAVAADRPQHGRQVDLPAPERADRRPGAGGLLRAGASGRASASSTGCSAASAPPTTWRAGARPSWSRWSRPRRS